MSSSSSSSSSVSSASPAWIGERLRGVARAPTRAGQVHARSSALHLIQKVSKPDIQSVSSVYSSV